MDRRNKLRSIPFVCPTITKRKEKIEAWPRERKLMAKWKTLKSNCNYILKQIPYRIYGPTSCSVHYFHVIRIDLFMNSKNKNKNKNKNNLIMQSIMLDMGEHVYDTTGLLSPCSLKVLAVTDHVRPCSRQNKSFDLIIIKWQEMCCFHSNSHKYTHTQMHVCVSAQNTSEPCGVKFHLVKLAYQEEVYYYFFSLSSLRVVWFNQGMYKVTQPFYFIYIYIYIVGCFPIITL